MSWEVNDDDIVVTVDGERHTVDAGDDFAGTINELASDAGLSSIKVEVQYTDGTSEEVTKRNAPSDFSDVDSVNVTPKRDLG